MSIVSLFSNLFSFMAQASTNYCDSMKDEATQKYCEISEIFHQNYEKPLAKDEYYCVPSQLLFNHGTFHNVSKKAGIFRIFVGNNHKHIQDCFYEKKGKNFSGVCYEKNGLDERRFYFSEMNKNEFITHKEKICSAAKRFSALDEIIMINEAAARIKTTTTPDPSL